MIDLTASTPHHLVRWVFQRRNQLLTCRVDRDADGSGYTMSLIPHGHVQLTELATFTRGVSALHEHARIAARLRQLGWILVEYTGVASSQAAAA